MFAYRSVSYRLETWNKQPGVCLGGGVSSYVVMHTRKFGQSVVPLGLSPFDRSVQANLKPSKKWNGREVLNGIRHYGAGLSSAWLTEASRGVSAYSVCREEGVLRGFGQQR